MKKKILLIGIVLIIIFAQLVFANPDLNNDNVVDIADLIIVASNFGTSNEVADTDNNSIVDIFDIVYVASRFGTVEPPPPPPPPVCTGTCKPSNCSSYDNCASASGDCTSGYCCIGTCTTPPPPPPPEENLVYAASLSPADIQAAVDSASPGDTVVLPSGTNNDFDTTVYISNGISMRGQGKANTVITRNSGGYIFYWNYYRETSSFPVEISDFKLIGIGGGNGNSGVGIRINEIQDVKVHDLELRNFPSVGIYFDDSRGIIYNSYFYDIYPQDLGQSGYGVLVHGDDVWDNPKPALGTQEAVFIEDCYFSNCKHGVSSNEDSKYVVRYNEFHNPHSNRAMVDVHGKQPQHNVGSNTWEIYENKVYGDSSRITDAGMGVRGGSGVIWNNKFYDLDESTATPPHKAINTYLDEYGVYPDDYPNLYQITDVYAWDNTLNDNSLDTIRVATVAMDWIKEDRDYYMYEKSDYTPYPYPHPLRNS